MNCSYCSHVTHALRYNILVAKPLLHQSSSIRFLSATERISDLQGYIYKDCIDAKSVQNSTGIRCPAKVPLPSAYEERFGSSQDGTQFRMGLIDVHAPRRTVESNRFDSRGELL